jgi:hypothetical protein
MPEPIESWGGRDVRTAAVELEPGDWELAIVARYDTGDLSYFSNPAMVSIP